MRKAAWLVVLLLPLPARAAIGFDPTILLAPLIALAGFPVLLLWLFNLLVARPLVTPARFKTKALKFVAFAVFLLLCDARVMTSDLLNDSGWLIALALAAVEVAMLAYVAFLARRH